MRTNWDRAQEGLRICEGMRELTGVDDLRSQMIDTVTQLMHTARLVRDEAGEPIDFDEILVEARKHFEEEAENDPDDAVGRDDNGPS